MILERLFEQRSVKIAKEFLRPGAGLATASGITVTPQVALTFTAVYAAVRIKAESVAMIPLPLLERLPDGGKRRAMDHPLYSILHDLPNPETTAYEFRETLQGHLETWGNCYAEVVWNRRGYPEALWQIPPNRVRLFRDSGQLIYEIDVPGHDKAYLRPPYIMHIRRLSHDGKIGLSPTKLGKQAIGTGLAAEEYGAAFFGNSAIPSGVLEHPGVLGDMAYDRVKRDWNKQHGGLSNAQRTAILEEGMKFHEIGLPPEQAQFLETRKFQVAEIARLFRVPPHMMADLDRATFSNIEQMSQEFLTYSLNPDLVNWEQVIYRDLLLASERGRYFAEFLRAAVVTADIQSRYQAYATGRQNGWLSANDIRQMENMNRVDGGDVYLVPLNMIPADMAASMGTGQQTDQNGSRANTLPLSPALSQGERERRSRNVAMERQRIKAAYLPIYVDTFGRVLRREANDVSNAARRYLQQRSVQEFDAWLSEFYQEHKSFLERYFRPVLESYAALVVEAVAAERGAAEPPTLTRFLAAYLESQATRHVARHEARLRELLAAEAADPLPALEAEFERWREMEPASLAQEEAVRANNALAVAAYSALNVTRLLWRTMGDTCPYCRDLDGKTASITEAFLAAGDAYQPEGAERPLTVTRNIQHPPAHGGCDCMVVAG